MKEKLNRIIARVLVQDFQFWINTLDWAQIRVADAGARRYASWTEFRSDHADWTLKWFRTAKDAMAFIVRHLGLPALQKAEEAYNRERSELEAELERIWAS